MTTAWNDLRPGDKISFTIHGQEFERMVTTVMAPYSNRRIVTLSPTWPFGHCGTCGKGTMMDCHICGQCATEANRL